MNPLSLPRVTIDFETRSELDVTDVGSFAYAEHSSTEILFMSYAFNHDEACLTLPKLWRPFDEDTYLFFPLEIVEHVEKGYLVEAHNALFERAIWQEILFKRHGYMMPKHWADTMATCAYRSLPTKLDNVGTALNLMTKKDRRGKDLIRKHCMPKKGIYNNDPKSMGELGDYCIQDTSVEYTLAETIGDLPPDEYEVWLLDQKINMRGVKVDLKAIVSSRGVIESIETNLVAELSGLTNGAVTTGGEVAKIKTWCNEKGAGLSCLTKDAVSTALQNESLDKDARRVLEIRQWLGRSSIKKLDKFFNCASRDGRIRGLLQYHGAGTGRWAGRMVQPQNLPRGTIKDIDTLFEMLTSHYSVRAIVELLQLHYGNPMEAISSSLRGMLIADEAKQLYVSDFKNIEARVVMWVAGQEDALDAFRANDRGEGPDIYCVMAESIYGYPVSKDTHPTERGLGKVGILGCGYQMAALRLQAQALEQYGIKIDFETAELIVNTFRETYNLVPEFWTGIEQAAMNAIRLEKPCSFRSITYNVVEDSAGKWLTCKLPSGRLLWYYNPAIEDVEKSWGWVRNIGYDGRNNKAGGSWTRVYSYGGMLTENIVQAISRDIMVESMFKVEAAGYEIILTVHDEVVAEVPLGFGTVKEFDNLMARTPHWAPGCPVACEGWAGPRYKKD